MNIEWAEVRRELEQALEIVQQEEGPGDQRIKSIAIDHCQTALLLMTGTPLSRITGHPKGSRHRTEATS